MKDRHWREDEDSPSLIENRPNRGTHGEKSRGKKEIIPHKFPRKSGTRRKNLKFAVIKSCSKT